MAGFVSEDTREALGTFAIGKTTLKLLGLDSWQRGLRFIAARMPLMARWGDGRSLPISEAVIMRRGGDSRPSWKRLLGSPIQMFKRLGGRLILVDDNLEDSGRKTRVTIIGAGPAGLSLGRLLQKRGIGVLILDKGASAGASWNNMPTHLRLLSPWRQVRLPDTPEAIAPTEAFVSAERYARYLRDYARHHGLSIVEQAEVSQVERAPDGSMIVRTRDGGQFRAAAVVNATGYFSKPFIPYFPGAASIAILQLHFSQYKDPQQIERLLGGSAKKALVVGKRLSAGQMMVELEEAGFFVELSARDQLQFLPGSPWFEWLERILPVFEWMLLRLGLGRRIKSEVPMEGGRARRLIESGRVPIRGDIERFDGQEVVFKDGRREAFDLILYATGFQPALDHLGPSILRDPANGLPRLRGFESGDVPGLFFLGLSGLRNWRSRFLRGIREDAEVLAKDISRFLAKHR
ncbi:MAG: FAD-dependent oxidoreductase [Elusimicrobia bacterium]|nr:FAD-dependent oxidoreductase [Elusimicrobiota bacterium]